MNTPLLTLLRTRNYPYVPAMCIHVQYHTGIIAYRSSITAGRLWGGGKEPATEKKSTVLSFTAQ